MLLDSPWVVHDEAKALFWFERAASHGHIAAKLKLAELKMLAQSQTLHDLPGANQYLSDIADNQSDNPEYKYLKAIALSKEENRDFPAAVKMLRSAIIQGNGLNWDVTPWQKLLAKWTSGGSVTITDK